MIRLAYQSLLFFLILFLGSCVGRLPERASSHHVHESDIKIHPEEPIAVVLKSYGGPNGDSAVTEDLQRSVESCIRDGARSVNPPLILTRIDDPRVRHRVEVDVWISQLPEPAASEGTGEASYVTQGVIFSGTVFHLKDELKSGRLEARAYRHTESHIGLAPTYSVPYLYGRSTPPTEPTACRRFGEELARFVKDSGSAPESIPLPAVPKTEDLVNCISGGKRQWAYRSTCD